MILNKYSLNLTFEDIDKNTKRLTNQLWKLIPMRENEENWKKQLDTVILEIAGLNELFIDSHFLQLISKLEGLKVYDNSFELYRKTVFEAITLLQEINRGFRV